MYIIIIIIIINHLYAEYL